MDEMARVQNAALAAIPQHDTALSYLGWAREHLPEAFPKVFKGPTPDANAMVAYWIARSIWNAVPLPSNRFRPKPLPAPKRNAVCPCGSGVKFKNCCAEYAQMGEYPRDMLWPLFVRTQPVDYWLAAADRLPTVGVLYVGEWLLEERQWKALVELLEPRFAPGEHPNAQLAEAVQWLCDAYDALRGTTAKKDALLARLTDCPNNAVRCVANLRLASTRHDRGDVDEAWRAWRKADKAQPGDPAVALIELIMLSVECRYEHLMKRADSWLARLANDPDVGEDSLAAIRRFKVNPHRAARELGEEHDEQDLDDNLERLLAWLERAAERPLPKLRWRRIKKLKNGARQDAHSPRPSAAAAALEQEWSERSGAGKPFSIDLSTGEEEEMLVNMADWLPWLQDHPEALDSFSVLDDLVMLLLNVDDDAAADMAYETLLPRAVAMLERHWPATCAGALPWVVEENRPPLRLLFQAIANEDWSEDGEDNLKVSWVRLYLRLNRNDNHGLRTEFVNYLFATDQNAEAYEVARRYPNDMFAETAYGLPLALYRLSRMDEADAALRQAIERLPLVARYLLEKKPSKPKAGEHGMVIGSDDQAWQYRRNMRGEWQATSGALEWLAAAR